MREVKFRAWDKEYNEMMDADYFGIDEYITPEGSVVEKETHSGIGFSDMYMVDISDKRILMQYTGLKDKNGVEIYESDVVEYTRIIYADCSRTEIEDIQEPITGEVYYAEGLWLGIKLTDGTGKLFFPGQICSDEVNPEIEVIGNIYENPELLEVSK